MAINEKDLEIMKEAFEKELQKQYRNGIAVGMKTACKVVLEALADGSKPLMQRIDKIKKFCKTPFGLSTEIESENSQDTEQSKE